MRPQSRRMDLGAQACHSGYHRRASEISEFFNYFVETARSVGSHVIDRNNLTIIETKKYAYLPEFLAKHQVEVVASLPCYSAENVNAQRGDGVFDKSISALKKLNAVGYGTDLPLTLVFNPFGAKLPPDQDELEADYKRELKKHFGIVFTRLFAITNLPIARFAVDLREQGQWDYYNQLLVDSFNPETVDGLMCRNTINIGWKGEVFDCAISTRCSSCSKNVRTKNFFSGTSRQKACKTSRF